MLERACPLREIFVQKGMPDDHTWSTPDARVAALLVEASSSSRTSARPRLPCMPPGACDGSCPVARQDVIFPYLDPHAKSTGQLTRIRASQVSGLARPDHASVERRAVKAWSMTPET